MTREEYIKLTGQDPVDMFGEDWEEVLEDERCPYCGGLPGIDACMMCKMD